MATQLCSDTAGQPTVARCDLRRQAAALEAELTAAAARVISSGRYILGPECEAFSEELAAYLGCRRAVGVANGTDALALALWAAGIGPGDRVLTSPFTFFATAEAIVRVGAEPVFADIEPATFNLDPQAVRRVLEGRSPLHTALSVDPATIRAVIPVHLFGQPAETPAFMRLASEYGLVVVEDAAQAIGADRDGRRTGTLGHAGCFSFFPSKNLGGLGDGGMVTTDDISLAEVVARLRTHGAAAPYIHEMIGLNSRLDELQAAFLRVKLAYLPAWVSLRATHARRYSEALALIEGLVVPRPVPGTTHAFHQYTVRVLGGRRDGLMRHLREHGIDAGVYYPVPVHLQPALRSFGYRPGAFPVAEMCSGEVLSLPIFPEMSEGEIDHVVTTIQRYYR